jgi:hypothetical protein
MKTKDQIFKSQYKKFSKKGFGLNWAKIDDVIESPNYDLVISCMSENERQLIKILKELKKPLNNIMNPNYDFGKAFDELKEFKEKYY